MRALALMLLVVALAGCGVSLSRPAPEKMSFLLHASRASAQPAARAHAHTLRINRFDVAQPFSGKPLVYRTGETRFETDFYNEFVATPAGMLTERTAGWLRDARTFRNIIPMTLTIEHRYVLEATGVEMYADLRDAAQPQAVLSIRFYLARDDAQSAILYDKTIARRVPLGARAPEAIAAGLDRALIGVLETLEADLAALTLEGAN